MAASIFINYRREDSSPEAGRLYSNLLHEFGSNHVFMDTSGIRPGEQWPESLEKALHSARLMVVVIGPEWLRASNEWGQRRIDLEDDWVRHEIEKALQDKKDILPVLVGRAKLPPAKGLPESIVSLIERQVVEIRDQFWDHDVLLVVDKVRSLVSLPKERSDDAKRLPSQQDCVGRWHLEVDGDLVEIRLETDGSWIATALGEGALRNLVKRYQGEWSVKNGFLRITQTRFGIPFASGPLLDGSSTWVAERIRRITGREIVLQNGTTLTAV